MEAIYPTLSAWRLLTCWFASVRGIRGACRRATDPRTSAHAAIGPVSWYFEGQEPG
jgi:hypothetical protein